jgi:hypothetical protein
VSAFACVPLYYFDTRDNDRFISDDVGLDLSDLGAARDQAAVSLAEMARDVLPGSLRRNLAVEVRDRQQPVLTALLSYEAVPLLA